MPVLIVDGVEIGQSLAISRYLAKRAGLVAADDLTNARLDAVVEGLHDVRNEFVDYFFNLKGEAQVRVMTSLMFISHMTSSYGVHEHVFAGFRLRRRRNSKKRSRNSRKS